MTPGKVAEHAAQIVGVRADGAAAAARIKGALAAAQQIKAWVGAQEAGLITQLAAIESFPEAAIAETSRCSLGQAGKAKERADTLISTPGLARALAEGAVTTGHIDAVTRCRNKLEPAQRGEFAARADDLVDVAGAGTIDQFARRLDLEVKRIRASDGEDRLTQQRRDTRLSTWTDHEGMWCIRGRFDPVTGVRLAAKLDNTVQALFAREVPELCPSDPIEKHKFLTAQGLIALFDGVAGTGRPGRPEFVVVIDADAPDQPGPVVDWPIPVEVPARVLAELTGDADLAAVVVRNGVVLHAPGELHLGRTTRLANRAQRRALRGLYRHCAIPGCSVDYSRCKLHHIIWWRHGGRTDLDNLLPVCSKHHTKIHNDGWTISLGPNRELTLRLPDGQIHNTSPPNRRAA